MALFAMGSAAKDHSEKHLRDPFVEQACFLAKDLVLESSGLALSRRSQIVHKLHFWTHNDSGGEAQLFSLKPNGKIVGLCSLVGVEASDWEDVASFKQGDVPRLLAADCGDNLGHRESIHLYVFDEPNPTAKTKISRFHDLVVTYEDGPRNCESVCVDPERHQIILISKTSWKSAGVYTLPLPERLKPSGDKPQKVVKKSVAKKVAEIDIPMATAMDRDPRTGDIWVINYLYAYRFSFDSKRDSTSVAAQFSQPPTGLDLPKWKQIEAAAIDSEGRLWVTSEGEPTPLGRVKSK